MPQYSNAWEDRLQIQKHTCKYGPTLCRCYIQGGRCSISTKDGRIEGPSSSARPLGTGTLFSSPDGTTERPVLRIYMPAPRAMLRSSDLLTRSPEMRCDSSPSLVVYEIRRRKCKLLLAHLHTNAVSSSLPPRVRSNPA
jgi:hypothetical protein